jgi:thiamine pyrophosphate-dependent acetolactate synthase large subunit-like protein
MPSIPDPCTDGDARTVRKGAFDVFRSCGLTTVFSNPGSTEIDLLVGLPADFRFVLALHEAAAVGMATGYALMRGEPALVNLHTTAGLGNAVGALATARVNRAALVVLVGQQDRRHLALEPFLAGRLAGLGGDYPVWTAEPATPQDVPGALARACHEAATARGPALVIVSQDDWGAKSAAGEGLAAPVVLRRAAHADPDAVAELAALLDEARTPALVVGAGADGARTWAALVTLAERLGCPVFQEAFGARAGFPQDHPRFAGHLPAGRRRLRESLREHDVVLSVGAPVFRQYGFEPGPLVEPGTRLALITDDPSEAHRSPVELALLAPVAQACELLAEVVARREGGPRDPPRLDPGPPSSSGSLRAGHILAALAERLPPEAIVVEETPSSRTELHARLPARRPMGFLSAAMGGLGFAIPAAIGLRMGDPQRPVVAVVGDGSSLYSIQALWSAAHYEVGALFVVLANGRYAVMDRLAESRSGTGPWPAFESIDVAAIARGLGCAAVSIEDADGLARALDDVLPTLGERSSPLVLVAAVEPDPGFDP